MIALDGDMTFSCSLSNNLFKQEGNVVIGCTVKEGNSLDLGSFNIVYSRSDGPGKIDFQLSKELVTNLISGGVDGIIAKVGKFFTS